MTTQGNIHPLDTSEADQSVVYSRSGDRFRPVPTSQMDFVPNLDVGVYTIGADMAGPYFQYTTDFAEPGRVYGNANARATRILNTFKERQSGLGVLCVGEKGSGKTMLTKIIAHRAGIELNIPTVIINQPMAGDDFCKMIRDLPSAVVLFDEFEKVYKDKDDQARILTLLEGVYSSNKLFLFTSNSRYALNDYMLNRPGRIYYYFQYDSLEPEFIQEYCEANLSNKGNIDSVCRAAAIIGQFNFDMLKSMVEEMNRYSESAGQVMSVLNIRPAGGGMEYDHAIELNGILMDPRDVYISLDSEDSPITNPDFTVAFRTNRTHTFDAINSDVRVPVETKAKLIERLAESLMAAVGNADRFILEKADETVSFDSGESCSPTSVNMNCGGLLPVDKRGMAYYNFNESNFRSVDPVTGAIVCGAGKFTVTFKPIVKAGPAWHGYL